MELDDTKEMTWALIKDTCRNLSCLYPKPHDQRTSYLLITMQYHICNVLGILGIYLLSNTLIFICNLHSINYKIETARSKRLVFTLDVFICSIHKLKNNV